MLHPQREEHYHHLTIKKKKKVLKCLNNFSSSASKQCIFPQANMITHNVFDSIFEVFFNQINIEMLMLTNKYNFCKC